MITPGHRQRRPTEERVKLVMLWSCLVGLCVLFLVGVAVAVVWLVELVA